MSRANEQVMIMGGIGTGVITGEAYIPAVSDLRELFVELRPAYSCEHTHHNKSYVFVLIVQFCKSCTCAGAKPQGA